MEIQTIHWNYLSHMPYFVGDNQTWISWADISHIKWEIAKNPSPDIWKKKFQVRFDTQKDTNQQLCYWLLAIDGFLSPEICNF